MRWLREMRSTSEEEYRSRLVPLSRLDIVSRSLRSLRHERAESRNRLSIQSVRQGQRLGNIILTSDDTLQVQNVRTRQNVDDVTLTTM